MDNTSYQFELGKFKCQVIDDGLINIPGDRRLGLNTLLVQTGKYTVLIDTGEGVGVTPIAGILLENLRKAGIKTSEIDRVILTHGHRDHIGGCADAKGQPIFPNARYVMHQKEWNDWLPRLKAKPVEGNTDVKDSEDLEILCARKNLLPIKERLDLVSSEADIVPGIKLVLAAGHTPGYSVPVISSDQKQLYCVGDVLHETAEFTTSGLWARGDHDPQEAAKARDRILALVVESHALVFINHFPFPGLGYIVKKGRTLDWVPFNK